ncbi:recombinase family protein [Pedobacter punctiformis]|uniref:Recombinase family protein n=1 Tax=Pedobacter punctiformis TaxID=3004097 RepID=A0ABT4LB50_9SPHI|nr:recombinase family protein [Pedobacter sp. HCMS5-2]MCZ4245142.1 recombinase family protein [Pedobacter sp. HCMS5-2]
MKNFAIGYRRISARDQSRYSLEFQEEVIQNYCSRNNLQLLALFTDNGERSDTFDRPDYKALEAFIKKHNPKVSYLIVASHDRFSRDFTEAFSRIKKLEEQFRLKVLAIDENIDIDVNDPSVFLKRAFAYLMANQELLQIRKRTKENINYARLSGRHVGKAPFGYINAKDRNNKTVLVIDEDKAEIIQTIFRNYLSGIPIQTIYKLAQKQGFNRSGHCAIQSVLYNPIYAGLIKIPATRNQKERYVKGIHQPIIKESDYWLIKKRSDRPKVSKSRPKELFPLRGILKCWCGRNMTAAYSKGKSKYYPYYRCTLHTGANYNGDKLHNQFEELLDTFKFSELQLNVIAEKAESLLRKTVQDQKEIIASRNRQISAIEKKQGALDELILNKEIDSETFNRLYQKLLTDKEILLSSRQESIKESEKWIALHSLLSRIKSLKDIYKIAPLAQKHSLLNRLLLHDLVYEKGRFYTSQDNIYNIK